LANENSGLSGIAERYATALYELADESKSLDQVADDLRGLKGLVDASDDLRRFLRSPLIDRQAQTKGMLAVLDAARVSDLVRRFVGVVGGHRRLFALPAMIDAFLRQLARRRGEIMVQVASARPLTDRQTEALGDALRRSVGPKINIEARVEPDLIGGLVVRVGSRMVDTSIRTQLQKLQRALRAA
jgi:F-type H+-transporting ATPase subunit delta